jgi:hypothetical protein
MNPQLKLELSSKIKGAGPGDILLVDPLSNSLLCGSDPEGNLVAPVKQKTDGT